MKRLICEMCGGTDLIKQDNVFVCQYCGAKYSVEEAKKMMIEGTVDVSGSTVKVDTSNEISNLLQIAQRAKNDNNTETAVKYYDMLLSKDPTNWEAYFYVTYYSALQCKIAEMDAATIKLTNCIDTVLKMIKNYVKGHDKQVRAISEVANRCMYFFELINKNAKNHYNGIDINIRADFYNEMLNTCWSTIKSLYALGDAVDKIFGDYSEANSLSASSWKRAVALHEVDLSHFKNSKASKQVIEGYKKKIQKYDPSFEAKKPIIDGYYKASIIFGITGLVTSIFGIGIIGGILALVFAFLAKAEGAQLGKFKSSIIMGIIAIALALMVIGVVVLIIIMFLI